MRAHGDFAARLAPWLAKRVGAAAVELREIERHAEGWSWQTYTLAARWPGGRLGLAVRVEPEVGLLPPYDAAAQFELHRAVAESSGVPIPKPLWLETDPSVLGRPFFVMERVRGDIPVQWRGDDPRIFPTPEARRRIGHEFVDVLTRIHAVDWRQARLGRLGWASRPEEAGERAIERWERLYEESALLEVPLLREAFAWLRRNVAVSGRLALCHGDYRIGNFVLRRRRIAAVLDWELAHVGDPLEDVAWSGLPLFRGRSPLLSQLLAPAEYFERYERRTGLRVEPEVFRFWTVLGLVRAAVPHLRGCFAFESGRTRDVRLAAMGHQSLYVLRMLADELGLREAA